MRMLDGGCGKGCGADVARMAQERVLLVAILSKAPGAKRPWQSASSLGGFWRQILRTSRMIQASNETQPRVFAYPVCL